MSLEDTGVTLGILGISEGEREVLRPASLDVSFAGDGGGGAFMDIRLNLAVSVGLMVRAPSPLILPDFLLSVEVGVSALGVFGLTVALMVGP